MILLINTPHEFTWNQWREPKYHAPSRADFASNSTLLWSFTSTSNKRTSFILPSLCVICKFFSLPFMHLAELEILTLILFLLCYVLQPKLAWKPSELVSSYNVVYCKTSFAPESQSKQYPWTITKFQQQIFIHLS